VHPLTAPTTLVVEHEDLRHAVLDWGGPGETLVLLHPNGLCAGFFDPLARRLSAARRVVAVDLRGHGGSDAPPSRVGLSYERMASDVVAVLDSLAVDDFSIVGESLGGGVGIFVDRLRPGALRRLVLCESIAFDPVLVARDIPDGAQHPAEVLSEQTRRRRAVWPDRAAARARYATRPPFAEVDREALDAYLHWGFVDRPDGQVQLACDPQTEATVYDVAWEAQCSAAAFAHLEAMPGRVRVLHGARSGLPRDWLAAQAAAADTRLRTVEGGHFLLHGDTARAEVVLEEELV
jgi:lipase